MANLLTLAPRGTQDLLPQQIHKWQYIEQTALSVAARYGFREIRFPTFEHTELFLRGVGETTDVVQKEMYTFLDKGERSVTLRPEGTAGAVRACLQNGLLTDALPVKLSYLVNCFRYEKPGKGRLREFHQFGAELLGAASPFADAQVISLVWDLLQTLKLHQVSLEINSIGCPKCRAPFTQKLKDFLTQHYPDLCHTCQERLSRNPLRILDCKETRCSAITKNAPRILQHLCPECQDHFFLLQSHLTALSIPFSVNPTIVRGLDYYTKTVFEFVSSGLGSQGAICGGGRYDGLIETLGAAPAPAVGFAMGLERLLMVMEQQDCLFPPAPSCLLYLGSTGGDSAETAAQLAFSLRRHGLYAETDLMGRSVKAQMKYANKIGAQYSTILGETELSQRRLTLKHMDSGQTWDVSFDQLPDFLAQLPPPSPDTHAH